MYFDDEQRLYLNKVYGINLKEQFKVRDGYVSAGNNVWWRNEYAPEIVSVDEHKVNIRKHPKFYSVQRPAGKFHYEEDNMYDTTN